MIDDLCHIVQSFLHTRVFLELELYKKYGFYNHIKICYNNKINKRHVAKYENRDYIVHLIKNKLAKFNSNDLDDICENNYIKSLKIFIKIKILPNSHAMNISCEENNLEISKILHELNYEISSSSIDNVFENGFYQMIKFLHQIGNNFEDRHLIIACTNGDFRIVKYLINKCGIEVSKEAIEVCIENYYQKIENYLKEIYYEDHMEDYEIYEKTSDDYMSSSDKENVMFY